MPEGVHVRSTDTGSEERSVAAMPPLIITCAITGDQQQRANPHLPVTLDEQAAAAAAAAAAGAAIVHVHARCPDDPSLPSPDPERYRQINAAIRTAAPGVIVDNTQTIAALPVPDRALVGHLRYWQSAALDAGPDLMSLTLGPMTFGSGHGGPSSAYVTTLDDVERTAHALRERGIKPQLFAYHAGHLDLLERLIARGALEPPCFVQLSFGMPGGMSFSLDHLGYMVRNLPADCIFQTCAPGESSIEANVAAILAGGHARTGMEDSLVLHRNRPAAGNGELVERVARIAHDLGRRVATPAEARQLLGLSKPPRP